MAIDTLERVQEALPAVAKRSDEVERSGKLPADVLETLTAAGAFRMMAPARAGGDELAMARALPVMTDVACADPSAGWVVGQVALSQLIIGCCSDEAIDEAFAAGPDLLAAGAVAPKGRATASAGGWRVSGQWPFVSGCSHATWFYFNCVERDGRSIGVGDDGVPRTRIVVLPASEVTVDQTWRVLGLRGTGSHDVRVAGALCPDYRSFTMTAGDPRSAAAAARIARSSLIIAAVAIGIAQGALTDVIQLASAGKRPALSRHPLSRSPIFQDRLGEAHMRLCAARALLAEQAEAEDTRAQPTPQQRAELRATAAQVTGAASDVVDTAYTLAGGSAVYDTSPLQRRLRDMRSATAHFIAGRQAYGALGAILVGEDPEIGAF